MANSKNSNRRKRKYGDSQKARTAKNKASAKTRAELRNERLIERTQSLIGTRVQVRTKDQIKPAIGTVIEVLRKGDEGYPAQAERNVGAYLKVRISSGDVVRSRHRVKPIREVN